MGEREWSPGEVAWVYGEEPSGRSTIEFSEVGIRNAVDKGWQVADGEVEDDWVFSVRPLVVIDAEDRDQIERFQRIINSTDFMDQFDTLQQALREFASPTPVKCDEPTGLGAVVEDSEGRHWVKVGRGSNWYNAHGRWTKWHELSDLVRVLSEGVQP